MDNNRLPSTRWNPSGWKTNCGFCAISYALEQLGTQVNADELYDQTLNHLGIPKVGNADPIPRMLIFPGPNLDEAAIRAEYQALEGRARGPADYTLWSVAKLARLDLKSGDKLLLNSLVQFAASTNLKWRLDDFVKARMNRPDLPGTATFASMKNHVENSLKGNSIIGSIKAQHFVNMSITPAGEWTVFDAQSGVKFDGRSIKARFMSLDLFERVSTGR